MNSKWKIEPVSLLEKAMQSVAVNDSFKTTPYEESFQMIKFSEYTPRGGWIKYRKRQEIKERVKTALLFFSLILVYGLACGIVGYIERGV